MHALHQEILAPSGVDFAAWAQLTTSSSPTSSNEEVLSNLVVARSNILRIFELRRVWISEGEKNQEEKFFHIRTHHLHGIVTGLEGVKVLGSEEDGRDRLLVSFKDAKIALLEWSTGLHDLITVSIHTYERAPQCLDIKPNFRSILRVDPVSRCTALLLPQDALAILPFYRREHDEHDDIAQRMDVDVDDDGRSGIPYSPSFILSLPLSVSPSIHNVIDFVFLPGFHNPMIAVLYSERPTWTGRLKEAKDTCALVVFSISMSGMRYAVSSSSTLFSVIQTTTNLPYDAHQLIPCPAAVGGGLVILTTNSLVYVDQATKKLMLPVNGWAGRVSDIPLLPSPSSSTFDLSLEGARATFISDTMLFLVLSHGEVYTVTLAMDGKVVSGMSISGHNAQKEQARTTIPSLVQQVRFSAGHDELVFVGSTQGPSVLLRTAFVEEEKSDNTVAAGADEHAGTAKAKTNVNGAGDSDMFDDDDIYGPSATSSEAVKKAEAMKKAITKARNLRLSLSLLDHIPSHGSINDMTFGLTRNGDKPTPVLIASTSTYHLGGFTLFQRDLPVRMKRKMGVLGGSRGVWSFALKDSKKDGKDGKNGKDAAGGGERELRMIISTDANPSPGFSRITIPSSSVSNISNNDIIGRIQGTTVGAGSFFNGTAVLQVMTNAIRVLEIDGTERQVIKDVESTNNPTTSGSSNHASRARIRACSISDPYVLVLREDDTMGLFLGYFADAAKDGTKDKGKEGGGRGKDGRDSKDGKIGKVRRKDMSMLGGKTSRYLTGSFFIDHTGMLEKNVNTDRKADLGERTADGLKNRWLMLVRPQGVMEIWSLPKMHLVFSIGAPFKTLENVLVDSGEGIVVSTPSVQALVTPTSLTQDVTMTEPDGAGAGGGSTANANANTGITQEQEEGKEQDGQSTLDQVGVIEQVIIAPLGESSPELHLFVLLRSGQLAIYQIIPNTAPVPAPTSSASDSPTMPPGTKALASRLTHLRIAFIKVFSKTFDTQLTGFGVGNVGSGGGFGGGVEQKKISRMFVPFRTTVVAPLSTSNNEEDETETNAGMARTYSGVFFTGKNPSWIVSTDHGGVHLYPSGHSVVYAFTAYESVDARDLRGKDWGRGGEFLLYSDEGPTLLEWIPDFQLDLPLPMRSIPCGRAYSSVVFDPSTSLVVAAAALETRFASFDEEGNRIWEPDAPNISFPITECSTLELISPDLWVSIDGYEFASNEVVNAVACVTLETASTEAGAKEFIAVGTTINRGEDLAAKGATYVFEIVEVVADPTLAPKRWYKLRLRCRDEAKGPVTALCGLNGYLVSSMGQKIFVRAFDSDERLVGVAFMDVGVYVTSLRTIKNLLLIGDAVKSISFVAFQEDPFKLTLLAKDIRHLCVTMADFFFTADEMAIFTHDEEGILRLYDYNPQDPESRDGRYLLLHSEFNSQAEYHTTALIAQRTNSDTVIPQAKLLCGATNGSIATITPVDESAAKRLQLLQGQLTRNMQHIAGLNPRTFRIVRNDFVSRPLSKNVLDGNLLGHFESLPTPRQTEMTKPIGTDVGIIRRDWMVLDGPW